MIKRNMLKKVIGGIVVGGLILSTGIIAMADTNITGNTTTATKSFSHSKGMMREGKMGNPLGARGGKMEIDMSAKIQTSLKELVASGTITQAKADELQIYMTKKDVERKAAFEKMKAMTAEQRKALFETQKTDKTGQRQDIFSSAVTDNILTQAQADAIHSNMQQVAQDARTKQMTDSLNTIVANKTITQDQMNKVLASINIQEQSKKDTFEKTKNMTKEERSAYFKTNVIANKDPLATLVTDGTLTTDQSTAIAKLLHLKGFGFEGGRGHGGHGPNTGNIPQTDAK